MFQQVTRKILPLVCLFLTLSPGSANAFDGPAHCAASEQTLAASGFVPHALRVVYRANRGVDENEFWTPHAHFDNEEFSAGSARLRQLRETIVKATLEQNYLLAQQEIGRALHAIQDFFAHSNFVDRVGHDLTAFIDLNTLADPPKGARCDNKQASSEGLTSGYFPDDAVPDGKCSHGALNKDSPERLDLHRAATVQAVAHGARWISETLDAAVEAAPTKALGLQFVNELRAFAPKSGKDVLAKALKCNEIEPRAKP